MKVLNSDEYRKLIETYNAGINVENGNILALADAIKTLYQNQEMKNVMCKNSKIMFDERFDRQKSCNQLIEVIETLTK